MAVGDSNNSGSRAASAVPIFPAAVLNLIAEFDGNMIEVDDNNNFESRVAPAAPPNYSEVLNLIAEFDGNMNDAIYHVVPVARTVDPSDSFVSVSLRSSSSRSTVVLASLMTQFLAVALPAFVCATCNLGRVAVGEYARRRYMDFVAPSGSAPDPFWADGTRLPDLLLDLFASAGMHASQASTGRWDTASYALPFLAGAVCALYLAWGRHYLLANRLMLTQSLLILLAALAENLTMVPSPHGYDRCSAQNASSKENWSVAVGIVYPCVAPAWSGRVMHLVLAGHVLNTAIEEDIYANGRGRILRTIRPKTFAAFFLATVEMALLAMAGGEYAVHILLGLLLPILVLTNPSLKMLMLAVNPYVMSMLDPKELALLTMPIGKLRNQLAQISAAAEAAQAAAEGMTNIAM
eukprot:CAMPEP_0194341716 /NCGR_PEP_ID=MMETSP0171-20130528/90558_1 /TAXON_ID=218684 /ORGANISM="Corethron pennatum, Strain L29A3" /LENGTH=406 /DNA_ID=CAMNT_0039107161 /DNA_START=98 /DNA_END=1318 /DNA_ORIENTATION=+